MESAILLKGKIEFENHFEDRTPAERESLILAEIYLKYEKSLRNLHIQEARLRRCREKDQAELTRLQTLRKREEHSASEAESNNSFTKPRIGKWVRFFNLSHRPPKTISTSRLTSERSYKNT